MKVKNINGTSDNSCKCGTWLKHWEKYNTGSQSIPIYCREVSCMGKPEVGAHVQKADSTDTSWYIVPLCSAHNAKKGESITLMEGTALASANVSQTCGKTGK